MLISIIAIIIGYLLGSISPSYILGKILRGIDIREYGIKSAGATNTKRVLGIAPAVIFKGLLAMGIAYKLGQSLPIIYISGIAAVVGHIFPFYLNFKGGEGIATTVGILLFNLALILRENFLPFNNILVLAILTLVLFYITRIGAIVGLVILPGLVYSIFQNYGFNTVTIFTSIIIVFIWGTNIYHIKRDKLIILKAKVIENLKLWRLFMRPLGVIIPIIYYFSDKKTALILVAILLAIFGIVDLVRLLHSGLNIFFFQKWIHVYKKREKRRFSSMTLFLLSVFLVFLIFDKTIAITAIVFLIFGDIFSKFFGMQFGKTKIFNKTLEGTLAYFACCLVAGVFLQYFLPLSLIMILLASATAAIVELIPLGVNDNLSVGIITSSVMFLLSKFI
ncbi:Glycerol-3-phosphate acyltransferase [subsurface metagenome]